MTFKKTRTKKTLLNKISFYETFTETSIIKEAEYEKHTETY